MEVVVHGGWKRATGWAKSTKFPAARGPRRAGGRPAAGPFLCFLYTPPAKLYPVFIRAFLSCEARIAKEKNVDALYLAVFAAIVAAVAALLQFCASLPQGDRA